MTFCHFCQKRGHNSSDCWFKNKFIKELKTNSNGKITKTYKFENESTKNRSRRSQSPLQTCRKSISSKKKKDRHERQSSPIQLHRIIDQPEIKIIREIKRKSPNKQCGPQPIQTIHPLSNISAIPSTSNPYTCQRCIKWEIRLQHALNANTIEKQESKRIIQSLSQENMKLRYEKKKLEQVVLKQLYQ